MAGRAGLEGLSVAAICAEAGLTARYFYESFPSREAIFVEAYRLAQDELLADIAETIEARDPVASALTGFFSVLKSHPGAARVFLVDLDDRGPAMKAASLEAAGKFAGLFAAEGARSSARGRHPRRHRADRQALDRDRVPRAGGQVVATALPFTRVVR